jgi:hypothetical protein
MEDNQNIPKVTVDFSLIPHQPPIEWYTGAWNGPLMPLSPDDPFGDLERFIHHGIYVTSITPPEQGWPIAMYCPLCKATTFMLSPWGTKPKDGDYHKMNGICADETNGFKHNMQMGTKGGLAPINLKPSPLFR